MTTLIIISFLIFAAYLVYILNVVGISKLSSLSESYYYTAWRFQVALFSSAALLVPALLELTPEPFKIFAFLTTSPILFVALSPKFKDKAIEARVHKVAAGISAFNSFVWAIIMFEPTYLNAGLFIGSTLIIYVLYRKFGQLIFMAEMFCFWIVYLTLLTT